MRHRVNANWKLQVENLKDTTHAALLHAFYVKFGIWRSDQNTEVKVGPGGGSSVLVSTASFKAVAAAADEAITPDFDLEDKRLIAYQREFEKGTGAILTIWPNLIVLQQMNLLAMRHVRPLGPNACIKTWTFFGYQDEAPELRKQRLMQANLLGPAGLVTIDDNEILAMAQDGALGVSLFQFGSRSREGIGRCRSPDDGIGGSRLLRLLSELDGSLIRLKRNVISKENAKQWIV